MLTAATILMIATVLGATEPTVEAAEAPATLAEIEATTGETELFELEAEAETTGAGDPLYDRLFAEQESATAEPEVAHSAPAVPPWLWIAGLAGLGGLYWVRQRKRQTQPKQGQVEVLGHTRMGTKSRLTVIRVPGEDGRMRRLLVSTGEGTPALVADLGSEADAETELALPTAPTAVGTHQPAAPRGFHAVLDEAVGLDDDIIDDDEDELDDGEGLGLVPPPKVPVWNETPQEFTGAVVPPPAQPERPAQATVPIAEVAAAPPLAEDPHPPSPLDALDAMLGDDDAPELVMDVSWDPETGWRGLPDLTADAPEAPAPPPAQPEAFEEPEESWDALLQVQASHQPDPLAKAGVKPSSRAAFEALLGGGRRQPTEIPRNGRIRPVVHTVKPVRPWDQPSARRTPYDEVLVDERDEVVQEATPDLPSTLNHPPRSAADVHDLVAEVLEERGAPKPQPAPASRGNGVVELARYLRRQVAP